MSLSRGGPSTTYKHGMSVEDISGEALYPVLFPIPWPTTPLPYGPQTPPMSLINVLVLAVLRAPSSDERRRWDGGGKGRGGRYEEGEGEGEEGAGEFDDEDEEEEGHEVDDEPQDDQGGSACCLCPHSLPEELEQAGLRSIASPIDYGAVVVRGPAWDREQGDGGAGKRGEIYVPSPQVLTTWLLAVLGGSAGGRQCPLGFWSGGWWITRSCWAVFPEFDNEGSFYRCGDEGKWDLAKIAGMKTMTDRERIFSVVNVRDMCFTILNSQSIKFERMFMPGMVPTKQAIDNVKSQIYSWASDSVDTIMSEFATRVIQDGPSVFPGVCPSQASPRANLKPTSHPSPSPRVFPRPLPPLPCADRPDCFIAFPSPSYEHSCRPPPIFVSSACPASGPAVPSRPLASAPPSLRSRRSPRRRRLRPIL